MDNTISLNNQNIPSTYTTHPRSFPRFRWYKPILTALLTTVFWGIFSVIISFIAASLYDGEAMEFFTSLGTGYDDMNVFTATGALVNLGPIAALFPALFLAQLIVRDRPFSSISSSKGRFRFSFFWKSLLIAFAINIVIFLIGILISGEGFTSNGILFTLPGFITLSVILPLQCIAEEYIYRGFLMQTLGAWFRLPVIAIILQAAAFAATHPYNITGIITILASGIIFGIVAHNTQGLEATCAMHIASNFIAFYSGGFGLSEITANVDIASMIMTLVLDVAIGVILMLLYRRINDN